MEVEKLHESVRQYWDQDAATYDLSPEHFPHTRAQQAAWSAVLTRHLPLPPARVLDVGREQDRSRFCWLVWATRSRLSTFPRG